MIFEMENDFVCQILVLFTITIAFVFHTEKAKVIPEFCLVQFF